MARAHSNDQVAWCEANASCLPSLSNPCEIDDHNRISTVCTPTRAHLHTHTHTYTHAYLYAGKHQAWMRRLQQRQQRVRGHQGRHKLRRHRDWRGQVLKAHLLTVRVKHTPHTREHMTWHFTRNTPADTSGRTVGLWPNVEPGVNKTWSARCVSTRAPVC